METTQRLVADHRNSLESAARRQRMIKGGTATRRPRGWLTGLRSRTQATPLAAPAAPVHHRAA